jgi:hypothetical protein
MKFDEIDDAIPNEGSSSRARRTSWPDGVYVERGGFRTLFRSEWTDDGKLKQTPIRLGFRKVFAPGTQTICGLPAPRTALENWEPSEEDREADDWVLL